MPNLPKKETCACAFVAGEPDDNHDVSEVATVSKYWLGELVTNVNRAAKDLIPEFGSEIAKGESYVKVKWLRCADAFTLKFDYEDGVELSVVQWGGVVRTGKVIWTRVTRSNTFFLGAADHRAVVQQADVQRQQDACDSDPDETGASDGSMSDNASDNDAPASSLDDDED